MTIYRTDRQSAIVAALCQGARRGARVRVVVELRARFDEERNARAAVSLAEAGVEVHHAPPQVKVHAKMLVVTRREEGRLRRYAHISSGNYNSFTARAYTDVGLLTCHDEITGDVQSVFDALSGREPAGPLTRVLAAPAALRANVLALIEREAAHARRGRLGRVILKMNALVDRAVILALYHASQAGVQIDLIVRGSCCLRPLVAGVSEHVRVRSIVGQYLEHSRIWYFHNGGDPDIYVGSADLMPRNLDRRVEVMVPLLDVRLRERLTSTLEAYLTDNVKARELRPDGSYARVRAEAGEPPFDCQAVLFTGG
jgi:polyphosphate kinase